MLFLSKNPMPCYRRPLPGLCAGRLARVLMAIALCVTAGCSPEGPDRQAVKGAVTLAGEPASGLLVVFLPHGPGGVGILNKYFSSNPSIWSLQ